MNFSILVRVCWLLLLCGACQGESLSKPILEHGKADNRVNLIFLSEGYTQIQQAQFEADAARLLKHLLGTAPFAEYRSYFNAYQVFVSSEESGSDHPQRGLFRNTYFNSSYDSDKTPHKITVPPNEWNSSYDAGQGKIDKILFTAALPQVNQVPILLVNDPEYGGLGGAIAIASLNELAGELILHELGHSFAGLGEEYGGPWFDTFSEEAPNTTRETRPELIKWKHWIEPNIPLPTPADPAYIDKIGLFEGAQASDRGWYRPALDCKMRTLDAPFCRVCTEAFLQSIYLRVQLIENVSPEEKQIESPVEQPLEFAVRTLQPVSESIAVQWYLNDVALSAATNKSLRIGSAELRPGTNTVRVKVSDATPLMRQPMPFQDNDPVWIVLHRPKPKLSIEIQSDHAVLSWPLSHRGHLEAAERLGGNWTIIKAPTTENHSMGVFQAHVPILKSPTFFRFIETTLVQEN